MTKFLNKFEQLLIPIAQKLNGQRHLAALRDGFVATMPLMIIGAFAVMINNVFLNLSDGSLIAQLFLSEPIPVEDYPSWLTIIRSANDFINNATLGIVALVVSFTVAYSLAENKGFKGLEAGVTSLSVFIVTMAFVDGSLNTIFIRSTNIITAIIVALIVGELFTYIIKKNFTIKMPDGVPPAVARSFTALIPAAVLLIIFSFIQAIIIEFTEFDSISNMIRTLVGVPLQQLGGGAIGLYVYTTMIDVFWFFGIHGGNTLAFMEQTIFTPAAIQNADLISQGIIDSYGIIDQSAYNALPDGVEATMYSKSMFDAFVRIGGGGATLGLIIATFIGSRVKANRDMSKYSLAPALFNINEPLLFGLPIVYNPVMFIPFIIVMPILLTTAIIATNLGIIPMYGTPIPWTAPPVLGAFLAYGGSISASIFTVFQIILSTLIYLPFVFVMNKVNNEENK